MYKTIIDAVRDAGVLLRNNCGSKIRYALKEKQSYVTSFDTRIEKLIIKMIATSYPNHTVYSEESGIISKSPEFEWYIDPLSNTRNFIHGLPGFAVAVGLMRNKKPIFGVVYDSMLDELYIGQKDKGAFCNGKKISVSRRPFGEHAFINVDWQKRKGKAKIEEGVRLFTSLGRICTVRAIGSVALTICYVAHGRLEAMVNNYSDRHAIIPAWPIIKEAGGEILGLDGSAWTLDSESTLVTNQKSTKAILACI